MFTRLRLFLVAAALGAGVAYAASPATLPAVPLVDIDGGAVPASLTEGKVALVVNVASKCGYTSQYKGLEALHQQYKARGLVILGAPCNQFRAQEPGTAAEIKSFCSLTYGVTFPLLAKQEVNGPGRSPLYQLLVGSPIGKNEDVRWNFEKFLVNRKGAVVARFLSGVAPDSAELKTAIEAELAR
jgi:glutathione peroxidase